MLDTDKVTVTDSAAERQANKRVRKLAAPPKRIRVSALAKEHGMASRELVVLLAELGEGVKTASSTLDQEQVDRVRAALDAAAAAEVTPPEPEPEPVQEISVQPTSAGVLFVAPGAQHGAEPTARRRRRAAVAPAGPPPEAEVEPAGPDLAIIEDVEDRTAEPEDVREAAEAEATGAARKRRRRGRRGRGGGSAQKAPEDDGDASEDTIEPEEAPAVEATADEAVGAEPTGDEPTADDDAVEGTGTARRRRRRRRSATSTAADGDAVPESEDDPPNTVVHVRPPREVKAKPKDDGDDGVKGVKGSTRLEARRQRRRDGRDTTRRRPPILSESEFLARREAVDRVMAVRQHGDRTQIAVLEDDVLVEHYVTRASATSYVGNVYLGRVQNVLPSMEAAFVDIAKGRNGVLYAGEVNWDAAGLEGKSRAIEQALKSGDAVLVQVTKDPIGHKGARLTSQISLPGRFLVYVPGGGMTGISRRLPDTERHRLKSILKKIVPEDAGVIVRTAAEGATEQDLTRDVERLQAQWASIQKKAAKTSSAPLLVHGEPDLAIRVVRDVFNEDFKKLVVQGEDAWHTVSDYIETIAPDLGERASRYTRDSDLFHDLRVDEQIMKALDRKVWLPSGGSLVIDRTEAMTVIDVNTGKFVGSGGNLEQTVTRNNLEAAEEIVRQLRLRDVGGIVVIDFIDMVLESNRELVLRRLTECLSRDRTKHQVAEVTSLGLVQMTRKRVGEGLLEAFSDTCEVCHGRGVIIHNEPVDKGSSPRNNGTGDVTGDGAGKAARVRRIRGDSQEAEELESELDPAESEERRNKALAAMNAIHRAASPDDPVDENAAELELDAVAAVLAASETDADLLAAEVVGAGTDLAAGVVPPDAEIAPAAEAAPDAEIAPAGEAAAPEAEIAPAGEAAPDAEVALQAETAPEADGAVDTVAGEAATTDETAQARERVEAPPEEQVHELVAVPAVARPRRRRAASRPAGPPMAG